MKRILFLVSALLMLNGCSSWMFWKDDSPALVIAHITAANNINPNIDGLASPLEVRIYQLADSEAFKQANFLDIYNDDQGALKADLLSKRQLGSVLPSGKLTVEIPQMSEVKYVGVIAAFANYREAKNKVIMAIEPDSKIEVNVMIDGINVSVTDLEDK
ncbi:type VI secretion system lipoprotein TssJ [Photobacterium sanguinicancri]|uniref:Type VI secretion system lipoprotein TssJ n=1 Tax=Photobacterium sanguinicancri TaxID=875932 RepID=A0AAW7Y9F5_9GAMM|nr:type VI secretion system lipoprotein TssJ [Photobacterium sanguinicancri]KXI22607.1 Type VI secretion lipoprotein/VasD [Photobacterium sanguinicancri]MDO6496747.1 type VI secretion system lipoprotein TssJ [Photobacterium sanguinicancri]MDO6543394.1 type VI secretion system lipoprotein TssJ [Photobacterium sanguinicancri]OZS44084.1 type VI secretion system-associated lipoprotein [Photobacterium sanguinicancri]